MKQLIITALVSLIQLIGFAQNHIDLANVYMRYSPGNAIEGSKQQRNFSMYVADAKLPLVINDNNVALIGMEYQQNQITYTGSETNHVDYRFSSSTLQVGLEHKWNNRSKLLFMGFGRLNGYYREIESNAFQLGGLAFGTTKRSENFEWKYGLYYNGEFFGPMFVPLFGFNWKINERWRLKTVLPINLELSYQPNANLRAGLRFDGVNGSYRMKPLPKSLFMTDYHVDKADNNVWLFGEAHLGKNIWFHLKAGHSVLRKYRFYENNEKLALKLGPVNIGDDRPETVSLFENGWSFEARFIYRLPLD